MKEYTIAKRMPGQSIDDWVSKNFATIAEASRQRPEVSAPAAMRYTNFDPATDQLFDLDVTGATDDEFRKWVVTYLLMFQQQTSNPG